MATIKPDGFTIEGLDTVEINAFKMYTERDGTMGLTGPVAAKFEAAISLQMMLEEVRSI